MTRRIENRYEIYDDHALIIITSRKYGEFKIKISLDDVDRCKLHHWWINKFEDKRYKSSRIYFHVGSSSVGMLHRYIVNAPKGKYVDHIDGDTLNNKRDNLNLCTVIENNRKQRKRSDNKSGHIGVYLNDHLKVPKWSAYIKVNGKRKHLGYFLDIEDAIKARKEAEEKYFEGFKPVDLD